MKYRTLGNGLKVSALGLGCLPMVGKSGSVNYGAATEDESIATIHRAIDLGVTLLIPPKPMVRTSTRSLSVARSEAGATAS